MTVLFVTDKFPPEPTTVGKIVENLATGVSQRGHQVAILTTGAKAAREKKNGIDVYYLPRVLPSGFLRSYLTLHNPLISHAFDQIVAQTRPDIVHFHNLHQFLCFSLIGRARKYAKGVFLTAHDVMLFHYGKLTEFIDFSNLSVPARFDYKISAWQQIKRFKFGYNPIRQSFINQQLKNLDNLFTVSNELRKALNQNGINGGRVIYNGIDSDFWAKANPDSVRKLKEQHRLLDKKVIFFGGRLSRAKGGEQLLGSLSLVVKKMPDAKLLIAGDKFRSVGLINSARRLGLKNNVTYLGLLSKEEMKTAYHASDIVVVPSISFDSFPTMVLEAMACGRPVIGTCFGGTPEIVVDNVTGYVINPLNTEIFAQKIAFPLKNRKTALDFGRASQERVGKLFTIERQVEETLKFYQQTVDRKERH